MRRLTEHAHDSCRMVLTHGEIAMDATSGNGHDTLFLAQQVGPEGTVFAFDLQAEAIKETARRLQQHEFDNVILVQGDHAKLRDLLPQEFHGRVGAVMFNLGYLPGGDKAITTKPSSTLAALRQSLELLRAGGIVTVLAYTGHVGGQDEADAVRTFVADLAETSFDVSEISADEKAEGSPQLLVVRKK